jgi:hypothetical protein
MMLVDRIIATALKEQGYKEQPINKTKYGQWYGLDGEPWCAMFVSWVFAQNKATKLIAQSPKGYAGCQSFETWAAKHKLFVTKDQLQAGDILLYDFSGSGIAEHTEIATSKLDPHTHLFAVIGGNTGGNYHGNQANGDGVYLNHRPLTTVRRVIRPAYGTINGGK